jgi:hypothetical protein
MLTFLNLNSHIIIYQILILIFAALPAFSYDMFTFQYHQWSWYCVWPYLKNSRKEGTCQKSANKFTSAHNRVLMLVMYLSTKKWFVRADNSDQMVEQILKLVSIPSITLQCTHSSVIVILQGSLLNSPQVHIVACVGENEVRIQD